MSEILVSPEELRGHAASMRAQATDAQTNFTAMKGKLEALAGQFRGQAAVAFNQRFEEWHTNATGLIQALDGLGTFLTTTADTVEQVDDQLARNLNQG
jgi:WXG100 family type VII secretion target